MKTALLTMLLAFSCLAGSPWRKQSPGITLAWYPSANIDHYTLVYGPSSNNYTNSINVTFTQWTYTTLSKNQRWYFRCYAVSKQGIVSIGSNEAIYTPSK